MNDSRSALNYLKRHIEADGQVQATAFLDPLEAIACAQARDFDIVLVDYEMPKMDGISSSAHQLISSSARCAPGPNSPTSRS